VNVVRIYEPLLKFFCGLILVKPYTRERLQNILTVGLQLSYHVFHSPTCLESFKVINVLFEATKQFQLEVFADAQQTVHAYNFWSNLCLANCYTNNRQVPGHPVALWPARCKELGSTISVPSSANGQVGKLSMDIFAAQPRIPTRRSVNFSMKRNLRFATIASRERGGERRWGGWGGS